MAADGNQPLATLRKPPATTLPPKLSVLRDTLLKLAPQTLHAALRQQDQHNINTLKASIDKLEQTLLLENQRYIKFCCTQQQMFTLLDNPKLKPEQQDKLATAIQTAQNTIDALKESIDLIKTKITEAKAELQLLEGESQAREATIAEYNSLAACNLS